MRYPQTLGFLLLLVLHALFVFGLGGWASHLTGVKPEAGAYVIGVLQLLYVVPVGLLLLKTRHPQVAKGMLKGALATFLVNMAGCAVFLRQLSHIM